jgi:hypothetical protein
MKMAAIVLMAARVPLHGVSSHFDKGRRPMRRTFMAMLFVAGAGIVGANRVSAFPVFNGEVIRDAMEASQLTQQVRAQWHDHNTSYQPQRYSYQTRYQIRRKKSRKR